MSTAEREFGAKPKYDHYENVGFYDDPVEADRGLRANFFCPLIDCQSILINQSKTP